MAKWIVSSWGGIRSRRPVDPSGNTSLDVFVAAIGGTRQSAEEFSRRQGMGGVASWSKLLAFAYPEFAVFDARTAMAANYDRLVYDGATTFFHMPPPRKKDIIAVRKQFRTRAGDQASFKLGYPDYLKYLGDRLESWKACGALAPEADIFDVEMRLFMIGPQAARKLLEKTASS